MVTGISEHAKEVVREIIKRLEDIESCEAFPYDMIDRLKKEYILRKQNGRKREEGPW